MTTYYYGENLTAAATPLQPIELPDLQARIAHDPALAEQIRQLRRTRNLDREAYRRLKLRLPFFCTSTFTGGLRRSEFFAAAAALVLDVDGCASSTAELAAWRSKLQADPRVAWLFVSPGGDGLKVVVHLDPPCTETKVFSDCYKAFAFEFAAAYQLGDFLDHRTSDCTRVCFLSADPALYHNPLPIPVDWRSYRSPVELPRPTPPPADLPNESHAIRPDVYREILRKLGTQARPPQERPPFVPALLEALLPEFTAALAAQQLAVTEARDIQYGKKLVIAHQGHTAEVNVFYGKKGFSVVRVDKRIHHESLGQLAVHLLEQVIYQRYQQLLDELPPF